MELWNFDEEAVRSLSRSEIVAAINEVKVSPVYGWEMDYKWLLGGKKIHNFSTEHISEATSIMNLFWTEWDPSKRGEDDVKVSARRTGQRKVKTTCHHIKSVLHTFN